MNWLTDYKIPVGPTAKSVVDWLTDNMGGFFDTLAAVMQSLIDGLLFLLKLPHPLLLIAIFAVIAWLIQRRISVVVLTVIGFLFIINQGYWDRTLETLTLVLSACFLCMAIGVPLGIAAAHRPALYAAMRPVLDLMQTLPTFVYLIPAIVFFGIGMVPGLLATAIFVLPAPVRLTHLGISSTPSSLIEAGEAFGASRSQLLWKIELPYAMPQILAGLTQTIMLSLSMVVIAALVGADGLGVPVVRALNSVNTALGFEAGLVIVVVAIVLDRIFRAGREK
ncbi:MULTISPECIES: choline ABC transporter permease subunit [Brucella/Ochrobactrum group]|uniref:Binding-protein-dependent transport systems inner membrane component n=8 Tax=Brucella/Ochrobactrum group TaxID=2826938 RepID=A6WZA0_BRUA4|nr:MULTISPECIES: choline ABC transporter permease subunit [Brucella/Ochrobactrum group]MCR5941589.1 choline ABC transporter permease subunit [Ochrobactrum sp. XJ1]QOD62849.1 choline ABC transporter permease subunit [Ochrobactrum sp. MT180101]QTN03265.1 choline ABC transporter permease subunit [Ochrobactrum sp. EEELCW01]RNL43595.1 choline ABC transporter permease subunit [Ochrobactrum sp. MH181795]ABS14304.1 binding-protein-dependent transport systems inner membrane component [Brucella anthropi